MSDLKFAVGYSCWFCLQEFADQNVKIIRELSYVDPTTVRVFVFDSGWCRISAYHRKDVSDGR